MDALQIFTFAGLLMFGGLVVGYISALWKNRDASRWAFIGFLCPPAIVFLLMRRKRIGPPIRGLSWDHRDHLDELHHNPPN